VLLLLLLATAPVPLSVQVYSFPATRKTTLRARAVLCCVCWQAEGEEARGDQGSPKAAQGNDDEMEDAEVGSVSPGAPPRARAQEYRYPQL
jgi:hypothetical protein